MAYDNPYANTMNYNPRTLWEQPERPRTDWSTFWGKAEEDDDDNGDENGTRGDETKVAEGAGSELKTLWGDLVADMKEGYNLGQSQNMFDNLFGPGITAVTPGTYNPNTATTVPNTQQYVGDWQNPDYTGVNTQVQQIGDTQATPAEVANFYDQQQNYMNNLAGNTTPTSTYAPGSYYGTQADVYAQYPELEQNWSWANNMPISAQFDQSGNLIDQGNAVVQTQGANIFDVQPTSGTSYSDRDIDFDAVTDDERDWGDFW